jgi:hypothetical protein
MQFATLAMEQVTRQAVPAFAEIELQQGVDPTVVSPAAICTFQFNRPLLLADSWHCPVGKHLFSDRAIVTIEMLPATGKQRTENHVAMVYHTETLK